LSSGKYQHSEDKDEQKVPAAEAKHGAEL
jgi:hypothetical protein